MNMFRLLHTIGTGMMTAIAVAVVQYLDGVTIAASGVEAVIVGALVALAQRLLGTYLRKAE